MLGFTQLRYRRAPSISKRTAAPQRVRPLLVLTLAIAARNTGAQATSTAQTVTLRDVIRAVADRHPLVDAARARVQAARGARRTAGAIPNPVLSYQVENAGFPGRSPPVGLSREVSSFTTLPLEGLWQRGPRTRVADEEVMAAEADVSLAGREVSADAARAIVRAAELRSLVIGQAVDCGEAKTAGRRRAH